MESLLYTIIGSAGATIITLMIFKAVQEEKNKVSNNRIKDLEDAMKTIDVDYVDVNKDLAVMKNQMNSIEGKMDEFHDNFKGQQSKFADELGKLSSSLSELSGTLKVILPLIQQKKS